MHHIPSVKVIVTLIELICLIYLWSQITEGVGGELIVLKLVLGIASTFHGRLFAIFQLIINPESFFLLH